MKTISSRTKLLPCSLLFLLVSTASLTSAAAQVIVPVNAVTPPMNLVTINNGTDNHSDAHVSGDWVAYTSEYDHSIRYYNFATNVDAQIPHGASVNDLLAEIRGSKIVFSRTLVDTSNNLQSVTVMIFDAATPAVAPVALVTTPGDRQIDCSIGGNTVAFIDYATHPNGDLVVYDLTTSVLTRLTNETGAEANIEGPEVSDDGNVVVWSKWKSAPFYYRSEIWQAVRTGGVWSVSAVSTAPDPRLDSDPDTNGTIAVYSSGRNNIYNIYWRPVAGGGEVKLDLPGQQFDPNITGNYITFAGRSSLFDNDDIYLYDIASNRVFQLTDTPDVREVLSEVSVLPNGDLRVVWDSDEAGLDHRNIHAATFTLPAAGCQGTVNVLGTSLPITPAGTITQGGGPNFAETYVTPYVATQAGPIASWKAEFTGGNLENGGIGVPNGIQLKVLRQVSPNTLQVVSEGAVHDPRSELQARFSGSYPFFQSPDSVIEFTDPGLTVQPGDIIGLTIKSDPAVGAYFYPLVSQEGTRLVMRDVGVGGTIDLNDVYIASLSQAPAIQVNVNACIPDTTPPVLGPLTNVVATLPLNSTATSMAVSFPTPTATDDSGSATVTTTPVSGAVFPVGTTTVGVTATDPAGNTATGSFTVTVLHNFSGFLHPVDNLPILNVVNAGLAIPVKFSLSGNKGLNIFAPGYPVSGPIACDANEPGSVIEETVTAGGSSLSYDATADRYTYVWKTDKAWKGTCRILALRLTDGSDHFAKFRFK